MIQKISSPGQGFRGVLNYALDGKKAPEFVAGNMAGENARSLAREFGDARAGNEAVGKPVFHGSLSADPGDQVTAERWRAIAEAYVDRMGYGDSLWVAVRHQDTNHDHVHIIASRVAHDGSRVQDHQDKKRGETIVRDLEREHGLHQVTPSREASRRAITRDELAAFERTGQVSVKARLLEHLKIAARDRPTMGDFAERLEAQGVAVRINVASTGRVSGISYALDGVAVKGSDVGRAYSWQGLQERQGITYEVSRDLPTLQALSRGQDRPPAPARPEPPTSPMPELEKPAAAFRQAAVVASRVEILERQDQLRYAQTVAGGVIHQARQLAEDQAWALAYMRDTQQRNVVDRLREVYADPRAAFDRMQDLIERQGYGRAAEVLREAPGELGRLRGVGVGPLHNDTREHALKVADSIGHSLRTVGETHAGWTSRASTAAQTAAKASAAETQRDRLYQLLRLLPDARRIERELYGAAKALGMAAVQGMSATIVQNVARVASRMVREFARGLDRDDGLGR